VLIETHGHGKVTYGVRSERRTLRRRVLMAEANSWRSRELNKALADYLTAFQKEKRARHERRRRSSSQRAVVSHAERLDRRPVTVVLVEGQHR